MKKLVISTGAGISAESGIKTFRDADGLWENHNVMDVCSATGFLRNPKLVHDFYNDRRAQLAEVQPNSAHLGLVELEKYYDVYVITQNVDDLHERAGSKNVLHLHGQLMNVRTVDPPYVTYRLKEATCRTSPETTIDGRRVRPDIVFFQEAVPNMEPAAKLASEADIFVVIGTTLQVYPAAALMRYVRPGVPIYYIDPNPAATPAGVTVLKMKATEGVKRLAEILRPK